MIMRLGGNQSERRSPPLERIQRRSVYVASFDSELKNKKSNYDDFIHFSLLK